MGTANIIKKYFHGQTWYFTGHGWSNVSARAKRYESLFLAIDASNGIPDPDIEVDSIICGRNQVRIFDPRRY